MPSPLSLPLAAAAVVMCIAGCGVRRRLRARAATIAAAGAAFCIGPAALADSRGNPTGAYAEMRWVERSGQTQVPAGAVPGILNANDANDATIWMVIEMRLVTNGSTEYLGFDSLIGQLGTNDAQNRGNWKLTPSGWNASPANDLSSPGFSSPVSYPTDRGIFAPFRLIANLSEQATGVPDPGPGNARIDQVAAITGNVQLDPLVNGDVPPSAYGLDNWVPVYTFQYDFTNLTPRTVTFSWDFDGGTLAIVSWDANQIVSGDAVPILGQRTYSVQIAPAPGGLAVLLAAGAATMRRRR